MYQYSLTLTGLNPDQQDFLFTSNGTSAANAHSTWKFGKAGLSTTSEAPFTAADFNGKDTMWVILDPAGPVTDSPLILLEAPRVLNILNPWPTTAPMLIWGGNKTRSMSTVPGRCGWFRTLLLDPGLVSGHFAEVGNMDTYGLAGEGSTADFDFAALFAAQGHSIWLNTQTQAWTRAWPNVDGICQLPLAAKVRDFSQAHPDFVFSNVQGEVSKGMVKPILGPDRKPVSTGIELPAPLTYADFDTWWITDSTNASPALRSYESCIDIPMAKSRDGLWEYDSFRDSPIDHSFFPLEGPNHNKHGDVLGNSCYVNPPPDSSWVTSSLKRNGNFCMESHASFIYRSGQTFSFRGDDDVWVFINDKLVVDLGGVHTPKSASVDLDKLNLVPGQEYKWDLFYCDRQPCGSALRMKTSIHFMQPRSLYAKTLPGPAPGALSLEIWKRPGAIGACAYLGDSAEAGAKAVNLAYQLLDATGKIVQNLGDGVFHGGITIATPVITIDTSKLTAAVLAPGAGYKVVASDAANPKSMVEIPFRMPASPTGLERGPAPFRAPRALRARNVLGRKTAAFPNRVHSPAFFDTRRQ